MNTAFDGLAFTGTDGVIGRKVSFSSIVELNSALGDRLFPFIMDGVSTN